MDDDLFAVALCAFLAVLASSVAAFTAVLTIIGCHHMWLMEFR